MASRRNQESRVNRMTPERWEQVKHLFEGALEVKSGSRAAFLEAACQGDLELRAELERLLAENEIAGAHSARLDRGWGARCSPAVAGGTRNDELRSPVVGRAPVGPL